MLPAPEALATLVWVQALLAQALLARVLSAQGRSAQAQGSAVQVQAEQGPVLWVPGPARWDLDSSVQAPASETPASEPGLARPVRVLQASASGKLEEQRAQASVPRRACAAEHRPIERARAYVARRNANT